MKRIILFFCLIVISLTTIAQTGIGWKPIYNKSNFKDTINISKAILINGVLSYDAEEVFTNKTLTLPKANSTTEMLSTSEELNILHNIEPNLKYIGDIAVMKADSVIILVGDTTVTLALGRIVFKTSDVSFYGCVRTNSTGTGTRWKKLNN